MSQNVAHTDHSAALATVFPLFGALAKAGTLNLMPERNEVHLCSGAGALFGIDTGPLVLAVDTWVDRFCPSSQVQVRELQASLNAGSAYPPLELGIFTPCGESRRIHLLIEPHPELPGAWMGLVIARGCCQEAEHREHALREKSARPRNSGRR